MKLLIPRVALAALVLTPTVAAQVTTFAEDFEGLDIGSPTALADTGWLVFGNVFDPMGGYLGGYGTFTAPNGGPGFSAIGTGAGGPAQGAQYLNVYNDYNNTEHGNGNYVEALVFRDIIPSIGAGDVGATVTFSFDYLKNGVPLNGDGDTTTLAFLKVLQSSNGTFATLASVTLDTTLAPSTSWTTDSLSLLIDPSFEGELMQIGFASTATAYNDSSRFYDNVEFDISGGAPRALSEYSQDFELLDMMAPSALSDDGWVIFGNVFDPMGGYLGGYGVFGAPNGGAGFSAIATGDGGPAQMTQYLNAYSDYANGEHGNGNYVEALVFQEQPIGLANVGETWRFGFDHRKNPSVVNGDATTTAQAFIKVIQTSNSSFATLYLNEFDSTNISPDTWASMALDILIDPSYAGETLQFGYSSRATNFDDTGRYYDNINWGPVANPGLGTVVCLGNPTSTGSGALLTATGSPIASANDVTLTVEGLPLNSMGIFVTSAGGILVYNPAMSAGHLCIASFAMGRYGTALNSGPTGSVSLALDLTAIPGPMGPMAVMTGDTRAFQYWTRDTNMTGAPSNFSSAVTLTFQ